MGGNLMQKSTSACRPASAPSCQPEKSHLSWSSHTLPAPPNMRPNIHPPTRALTHPFTDMAGCPSLCLLTHQVDINERQVRVGGCGTANVQVQAVASQEVAGQPVAHHCECQCACSVSRAQHGGKRSALHKCNWLASATPDSSENSQQPGGRMQTTAHRCRAAASPAAARGAACHRPALPWLPGRVAPQTSWAQPLPPCRPRRFPPWRRRRCACCGATAASATASGWIAWAPPKGLAAGRASALPVPRVRAAGLVGRAPAALAAAGGASPRLPARHRPAQRPALLLPPRPPGNRGAASPPPRPAGPGRRCQLWPHPATLYFMSWWGCRLRAAPCRPAGSFTQVHDRPRPASALRVPPRKANRPPGAPHLGPAALAPW